MKQKKQNSSSNCYRKRQLKTRVSRAGISVLAQALSEYESPLSITQLNFKHKLLSYQGDRSLFPFFPRVLARLQSEIFNIDYHPDRISPTYILYTVLYLQEIPRLTVVRRFNQNAGNSTHRRGLRVNKQEKSKRTQAFTTSCFLSFTFCFLVSPCIMQIHNDHLHHCFPPRHFPLPLTSLPASSHVTSRFLTADTH